MVFPRTLAISLSVGAFFFAAQAPPVPQQPLPAQATPSPVPASPPAGTVVIDPGHGGTDAGARGSSGVLEKDVVMSLAQLLRGALERQGFRVVLTRQAGDNPNYDDRAGTANAYRGALLVTLHASSTGTLGIARAYFQAPVSVAQPPAVESKTAVNSEAPTPRPVGLVPWEEAQRPFVASSRRLAEAVQAQIKQKLEKSPGDAAPASLRDLRSITGPAIAVELASVSVKDRKLLDPFLAPLAEAIAQGVRAYRGSNATGGAQ